MRLDAIRVFFCNFLNPESLVAAIIGFALAIFYSSGNCHAELFCSSSVC